MSFISEAEEALLINFSEDCKYCHLYLGSVLGFISKKKTYTLEDTFYLENKRHKSHEMHCYTAPSSYTAFLKHALSQKSPSFI